MLATLAGIATFWIAPRNACSSGVVGFPVVTFVTIALYSSALGVPGVT